MKKLLLCLLIVNLASCSKDGVHEAGATAQGQEACANLAKFSEQAMSYHQSNVLMDDVFKEVDTMANVPSGSKQLLKDIVVEAYKQPVFTDQSFRDRQRVDFANDVHLKCLESMK